MFNNLDYSVDTTINRNSHFNKTPSHSTPKSKDSLEEGTLSDHYSELFESFISQQDNDNAKMRCASILSQSSKDSGRHTDSPSNGAPDNADSLIFITVIRQLVAHVEKLELEVQHHKENNQEMKIQLSNVNVQLEMLKNGSESNTRQFNSETENEVEAEKLLDLEKEVQVLHRSERSLKKEVEAWKEDCNDARKEVEELKGELSKLRMEKAKVSKERDQLMQQLHRERKQQETHSGPQQITPTEHNLFQERLNRTLVTLNMVLCEQVNILKFYSDFKRSLSTQTCNSGVHKKLNRTAQEHRSEVDRLALLIEELSEFVGTQPTTWWASSADQSYDERGRDAFHSKVAKRKIHRVQSVDQVKPESKPKQTCSLPNVPKLILDDKATQKLSHLLATSHKMLNLLRPATPSSQQ